MAIQNRRGDYTDFDAQKMKPGEFAIVQENDPIAIDGEGVYIAFQAGIVKRLATHDEMVDHNAEAETILGQVNQVATNIQTTYQNTVTKASEASQSASDAQTAKTATERLLANAETDIEDYKDDAIDDINNVYETNKDDIEDKIQYILNYTATSNQIANQALTKANETAQRMEQTEGRVTSFGQNINDMQSELDSAIHSWHLDASGRLIFTDANGNQIGDVITKLGDNADSGFAYASCGNSGSDLTATVSSDTNFSLSPGGIVVVRFSNNVVANATLNINNTGAKAIMWKTSRIGTGTIKANDVVTFIYSGNSFIIANILSKPLTFTDDGEGNITIV